MLKDAQVLNLKTVCYLKTSCSQDTGGHAVWSWFVAWESVTVCLQIPVTEFCFHFPVTVLVTNGYSCLHFSRWYIDVNSFCLRLQLGVYEPHYLGVTHSRLLLSRGLLLIHWMTRHRVVKAMWQGNYRLIWLPVSLYLLILISLFLFLIAHSTLCRLLSVTAL